MSKEDYKEFKKNVDEQEREIKLGYEKIKAKVKKPRSGFQKFAADSTRSGSGRIIKDNYGINCFVIFIWFLCSLLH